MKIKGIKQGVTAVDRGNPNAIAQFSHKTELPQKYSG